MSISDTALSFPESAKKPRGADAAGLRVQVLVPRRGDSLLEFRLPRTLGNLWTLRNPAEAARLQGLIHCEESIGVFAVFLQCTLYIADGG